jgi:predicted DNA-binding transcriptional regulator YafY
MLSIPAPLAELGVDQELRAALQKLAAALPDSRRSDEQRARQRIHLDLTGWSETREPVPHLKTVQQAVWHGRRLHLTYRLPFGARAEWRVEPLGLVAKANTWYLVCGRDGHRHVYYVSRVLEAALSEESFEHPADFDLAAFWQAWCIELERNRPRYPVTARVSSELIPWLPYHFGDPIRHELAQASSPDDEGRITLTLPFETLEAARERILSFGHAVEVLAPRGLRKSVEDYALQIVALYQ